MYVPKHQIPLKRVELRTRRKISYPLGFGILFLGERTENSEKHRFAQHGQGYSTGLHTLLRSGACGLEGLTGTESPAAEGMYITGAVCVGLDTAEDCCKSSLSAGSAGDKAQGHPSKLSNCQGAQNI